MSDQIDIKKAIREYERTKDEVFEQMFRMKNNYNSMKIYNIFDAMKPKINSELHLLINEIRNSVGCNDVDILVLNEDSEAINEIHINLIFDKTGISLCVDENNDLEIKILVFGKNKKLHEKYPLRGIPVDKTTNLIKTIPNLLLIHNEIFSDIVDNTIKKIADFVLEDIDFVVSEKQKYKI